MDFLTNAISQLKEFQTIQSAVHSRKLPAAITGLSGVHKANMIYSLSQKEGRGALVIAADEAEAQRMTDDLSSMGMHPVFFRIPDIIDDIDRRCDQ